MKIIRATRVSISDHCDLSGGCTVAIVMLSFFNPEDLPGQPPARTRYSHSVTTFNNIWRAGQFVFENCIQYRRSPEPGWNNAGEGLSNLAGYCGRRAFTTMRLAGSRHSVGIFFWATNSEMDIRISHGPWRGPQFNASLEIWNTTSTVDTA